MRHLNISSPFISEAITCALRGSWAMASASERLAHMEGYVQVCERIFGAIGTAYPFLKEEFDRQLAERVIEDEDDA